MVALPTAGREVDKEGRRIDATVEREEEGFARVQAPFMFMLPSAILRSISIKRSRAAPFAFMTLQTPRSPSRSGTKIAGWDIVLVLSTPGPGAGGKDTHPSVVLRRGGDIWFWGRG